jgi:hypothetical protein
MPLPAKEIRASLLRKGFQRRNGQDVYLHLWADGKKTPVYTKISHGEREVHDSLIASMAKQVKLSKRQFFELVECSIDAEEYLRLMRDGRHIG